jgi:secreted trypsin-like serine protease
MIFSLLSTANALPPAQPQAIIVGGFEVFPEFRYPWLVSIQDRRGAYCGGILVNSNTIITAAHCSEEPPSRFTVLAHRHDNRKSTDEEKAVVFSVEKIIPHPSYNGDTMDFDAAVWKLNLVSGDPSTALTKPIKLDNGTYSADGTNLVAAGWGTTSSGGPLSDVLMEVPLPVVTDAKCKQAYPKVTIGSSICAGYDEGGKDACQSDSGGPLFYEDETAIHLVGLTSYGNGCGGRNAYGVYARIMDPSIQEFLLQNI